MRSRSRSIWRFDLWRMGGVFGAPGPTLQLALCRRHHTIWLSNRSPSGFGGTRWHVGVPNHLADWQRGTVALSKRRCHWHLSQASDRPQVYWRAHWKGRGTFSFHVRHTVAHKCHGKPLNPGRIVSCISVQVSVQITHTPLHRSGATHSVPDRNRNRLHCAREFCAPPHSVKPADGKVAKRWPP